MNLPNGLTVGRIAITPLIAALPFVPTSSARITALGLFVGAALTDWWDGYLARTRKQETDFGRMLDPLADKLLLLGTFIPMYFLAHRLPFHTVLGDVRLPWWVVAIILGREVTMTWFRQYAARRGVVISAIWPAKWKTFIQLFWTGAAYTWFAFATLARDRRWNGGFWQDFAVFNGTVAASMMMVAVALTLYSLYVYLRDYGYVLRMKPVLASSRGSIANR